MAKKNSKPYIPPPPNSDASPEELATYFEKYDMADLEAAGYVSDLSTAEIAEMDDLAATCQLRVSHRKSARTQLNLALTPEQFERFINFANKTHIPASTLAKAWLLERLDKEATEA